MCVGLSWARSRASASSLRVSSSIRLDSVRERSVSDGCNQRESRINIKLVQKTHVRKHAEDLSDAKEVALFDVDGHGHAAAVGDIGTEKPLDVQPRRRTQGVQALSARRR